MPDFPALGRSGLKVSRLWLGAMMFGDQTPEAEARSILDATREAGLNAIDVADVYARGESERMVGRLVAADRDRWVIATKVGNAMGEGPNERGLSRRWMTQAVEGSLSRLGTDWIDLYYLHRDDPATPLEEIVGTMGGLVQAGKIRYWGLSNFRAWRIAQVVETARRMGVPQPVACQPPYSAVTRLVETEVLPACDAYGLGVVGYSPLARGVLSGKYAPNAQPPEGSRAARGDRRILQTEFRTESVEVAQAIKAHAESRGLHPTHFAIAWVLRNRLVHGVIGGPRTRAQWQDYLAALEVRLEDADEALVDSLVPPGYASTHGYNDPQYPLTGRMAR